MKLGPGVPGGAAIGQVAHPQYGVPPESSTIADCGLHPASEKFFAFFLTLCPARQARLRCPISDRLYCAALNSAYLLK